VNFGTPFSERTALARRFLNAEIGFLTYAK
jgi:hypothetical protein